MHKRYSIIIMKRLLFLALLLICGMPLLEAQAKGAKIEFAETLYNFGNISEEGGDVSHEFVFTNTGDAPLVIYDVNTNCGCTDAGVPQAPIVPGGKGKITIVFHPAGNPGEFAKEIVVKSSASNKKTKIRIKGIVFPKQ